MSAKVLARACPWNISTIQLYWHNPIAAYWALVCFWYIEISDNDQGGKILKKMGSIYIFRGPPTGQFVVHSLLFLD